MRERIAGYADALIDDAAAGRSLPTVADELAGVERLLDDNPDLRVVLGDPGVAAHVRRGVLQDLFGSRLEEISVRLLVYAAQSDRATEFRDDVAWLAARAAARRDGLVAVGEFPLGRHGAAERIEGYANARLEPLAGADALGEIEDEMFRFMRVVDGSDELRAALTSPGVPTSARRGLVADLLAGKASEATASMAGYAAAVGRPRDYLELLSQLVDRIAEEADRRVADVRTVVPLSDEQRRRIAAALERMTGRAVDVRGAVDRRVLGGFVATMGDTVIDASARHRLDLLKERLMMPEATVAVPPTDPDTGEHH